MVLQFYLWLDKKDGAIFSGQPCRIVIKTTNISDLRTNERRLLLIFSSDKIKKDLQHVKREIENISDRLDTLMAQRETEDEGQF